MTNEAANQSPDALADALMELLTETPEQPKGGEGNPSQEGQQAEPPAEGETQTPNPQDGETPIPPADDFETRYAARRQTEAAEEQRSSRMAELEKLIEEGDDAEVGKLFRQEYTQLKTQGQVAQQVATTQANQIIEGALDKDFIEALSQEEAAELHGYVTKLEVPKFLSRVIEIKAGKAGSTFDETEVDRRVQEKLQAAQNTQRGNQVRNPSPTAVPAATEKGPPANASNDDLWAAAIDELAEAAQAR